MMRSTSLVLTLAACASPAVAPVRFANVPPVTIVDDRLDVPQKPERRTYLRMIDNLDSHFFDRIDRQLAMPNARRARGTSSIDEVPDSTWFTNRIGVREVAPDELRENVAGNPERYTPWTIHSTKVGGTSVGFIVSDMRGHRFLVKFDRRGYPEAETAAQVITSKLLWAAGYNVTDDHIAYVRREDLVLARDAVAEDELGHKRKLDRAMVDRKLAMVEIEKTGRIRTMASRMVDGKALGGHPGQGTRIDDPNDRIPHERRRDLRGANAIFSWLDHTDVKQGQTLDVWVTDKTDPRRRYVKHYLIDYGGSLGVLALVGDNLRRGYEYKLDGPVILRSLLTLGMSRRTWAHRKPPNIRGVGVYEPNFSPATWKPAGPVYMPFVNADRFDNFWGAKLIMRFTRQQLRAAVDAGRLSDPRAVDYLVETLIARQRTVAAYWFARVNPLDNVSASHELCFDDLMLVHQFASPRTTTYTLQPHDRGGRAFSKPVRVSAAAAGRTCVPLALSARDRDNYTIVRVSTSRPGFKGATDIHLAREPETGAPRVIGIWRE